MILQPCSKADVSLDCLHMDGRRPVLNELCVYLVEVSALLLLSSSTSFNFLGLKSASAVARGNSSSHRCLCFYGKLGFNHLGFVALSGGID